MLQRLRIRLVRVLDVEVQARRRTPQTLGALAPARHLGPEHQRALAERQLRVHEGAVRALVRGPLLEAEPFRVELDCLLEVGHGERNAQRAVLLPVEWIDLLGHWKLLWKLGDCVYGKDSRTAGPYRIALNNSLNVARGWPRNCVRKPRRTAFPFPTLASSTAARLWRYCSPSSQPLRSGFFPG